MSERHPVSLRIGSYQFDDIPSLVRYYQSPEFERDYTYFGNDLGCTVKTNEAVFKLWSPAADEAEVLLYHAGSSAEGWNREKDTHLIEGDEKPYQSIPMNKGQRGVFEVTLSGDFHGIYYTYRIHIGDEWTESADPYAKAAGVNGRRSMAVDLKRTNPEGWERDSYRYTGEGTEAIIWEVHVRDFSYSESSGMKYRGKYLAFTEKGTVLQENGVSKPEYPTGVDYLQKLGITHVQFLPLMDYATVDESKPDMEQYNWGYDPLNYMVPEGSYSTDPFHGEVRIREMKQMIQALHKAGIGVVMDVVYNHTYFTEASWFHKVMPYYYHRTLPDGTIGNASGCGNETASERSMFRLYMLDSLRYLAEEYHVDGFRFDLMGIHDVDTMNEIRSMLDGLKGKNYLTYGEPWAALPVAIPPYKKHPLYAADKPHMDLLDPRVRVFDDVTRDLIKGDAFEKLRIGYANGAGFLEKELADAILGHPGWTSEGREEGKSQSVTYVSSHDNYTLWDKLTMTASSDGSGFDSPELIRLAVNKLCASIVLTSQGMSFMQAGEEFGRTKYGEGNSYNAESHINMLDWRRTVTFRELTDYYRGLIAIRRMSSCLTDESGKSARSIVFHQLTDQIIAYTIRGRKAFEPQMLVVIFNAGAEGAMVDLTSGLSASEAAELPDQWNVLAGETYAGVRKQYQVDGTRFYVYTRGVLIASSVRRVADELDSFRGRGGVK